MVRSWWLISGLLFGCAGSAESSRPSAEAPAPGAAQSLASPAEVALPDAGLTLQPMVPPSAGTIPEPRLELEVPPPAAAAGATGGGAAGFRAVQNDAPAPTKSGLHIADRPYSATPPRPDSQGRMPVPKHDPNAPTVPVQPKGPASTNAPPADR
jgi:hypothetical protein